MKDDDLIVHFNRHMERRQSPSPPAASQWSRVLGGLRRHQNGPGTAKLCDSAIRVLRPKSALADGNAAIRLLAKSTFYQRGYVAMPADDVRVMVPVDRDRDECHTLKARLEEAARAAGMPTKTHPAASGHFRVVNRIAIEELEAWFIGDIEALRSAFPRLPVSLGQRTPFRDPDAVPGGTWVALHRVLRGAGHYVASDRLPKVELARLVANEMQRGRNRSASVRTFVGGFDVLISDRDASLAG